MKRSELLFWPFLALVSCGESNGLLSDAAPPSSPDAASRGGTDAGWGDERELRLARHWAPVFYQDTDSSNYAADYVTAIDYDGDWVGNNNWDSLEDGESDLRAYIYYSAIESETHWFLLYLDFHPRDWQEICFEGTALCHENDLEGAMVVVEKDDSPSGRFFALVTQAHGDLNVFTNDASVEPRAGASFRETGVTFEDDSHVELFVEAKGHGVCASTYDGLYCGHEVGGDFPGGDGIVYRLGDGAEVPESGNDRDVRYELLPFEDTVWPHRAETCGAGCLFDDPMYYEGMQLGRSFDGDDYGDDSANPPWAWNDGNAQTGDFFFRPADALAAWLTLPESFSHDYVYNPYLPQ